MGEAVEEVPLGEAKGFENPLNEATQTKDSSPHDTHNVVVLWVKTEQAKHEYINVCFVRYLLILYNKYSQASLSLIGGLGKETHKQIRKGLLAVVYKRRKIRRIESNGKCRYLKN